MRAGISQQVTNFPFEEDGERCYGKLQRSSDRHLVGHVSVAQLLTLAGNAAPTDPTQHPNQNFAERAASVVHHRNIYAW